VAEEAETLPAIFAGDGQRQKTLAPQDVVVFHGVRGVAVVRGRARGKIRGQFQTAAPQALVIRR
jgi:hypothetical protein